MYDLNVKLRSNDRDRISLLKRAVELGWNCIVWNTCFVGKVNGAKVKLPKPVAIPRVDLDEVLINRVLATSNDGNIEQLNRITITVDDVYDAQSITSGNEVLKQFDIVAVCPGNAKIFNYLCKTADIDIISIDFSHKVPFTLNKKLIDEAIKRGIFFEISYGSLLQTAAIRREVISGTRVFLQFLRGNNLILSSGSDSVSSLRGPFDVVNMGQLLKLTTEQAKRAISDNCEELLKRTTARKLRYTPVEVTSLEEYSERKAKSLLSKRENKLTAQDRKKVRREEEEEGLLGHITDEEEMNDDSADSNGIKDSNDDGVWKF